MTPRLGICRTGTGAGPGGGAGAFSVGAGGASAGGWACATGARAMVPAAAIAAASRPNRVRRAIPVCLLILWKRVAIRYREAASFRPWT
ncbi:hypothetical protein AYK61_23700 [Rhodococcus sp. SBT000017]|nr:hypothetical protein AYK61_23700 [Rhodococcus sp. SBT000017]